jgi:Beta-lactamase enzyme family
MNQQPDKYQSEKKIAELQDQLKCTYEVIVQLKKENAELQAKLNQLQNSYKQQSNNTEISRPGKYGSLIPDQSSFDKLSKWRFSLIVGVVAGVVAIAGLIATRMFKSHSAPQSAKPTTTTPIPVNSPTLIPLSPNEKTQPSPINTASEKSTNLELTYNIKIPQPFNESPELKAIVDDVVNYAKNKNLPTEPLSITLIDVKSRNIAGYKQDTLRYPASLIKMFWMVILYAQIEKGLLSEADFQVKLQKMLGKSDNNTASDIVDVISQTKSGELLKGEEYQAWLNKRKKMNRFFEEAGYADINISQKIFPITDKNITQPQGRDLQIRGDKPDSPIRNKMTTYHAARLLYEISHGMAVSEVASQKMSQLLTRNVNKEFWSKQPPNPIDFNPVESFFGESIPVGGQFLSKAGWTLNCRNEAAFIATERGDSVYILVVFADDTAYAADKKIFPEISSLVYRKMKNRNSKG